MHFRKGQMIQLKNTDRLKEEYKGQAGVIVEVHKKYLSVKIYKGMVSAVPKEDVARVL